MIKLNRKTDLVEEHGQHSCQTDLKMEVDKEYGMIDGYVFCKDPGRCKVIQCMDQHKISFFNHDS